MDQQGIFCPKRRVLAITRVVFFLCLLIFGLSLFLVQPLKAQAPGSISGVIFEDLNFNQTPNLHEARLAGWEINLYQGNNLIQTQKANLQGEYNFSGLKSDNYKLALKVPDGWAPVSYKNVLVNLGFGGNIKINFSNYQVVRSERGIGPSSGMSISNQSIQVLSPTSVKIIWFTNRKATSQVVFSQEEKTSRDLVLAKNNLGYSLSTHPDFEAATFRSVVLTNLEPGTTYYYQLISLPDPKQWRGAVRRFSSALNFTTQPTEQPKEKVEVLPTPPSPTPPAATPSRVVAGVEFKAGDTKKSTAEETAGEATTTEEKLEEQPDETAEATTDEEPLSVQNCAVYIWILLILNIAALAYAVSKSKDTPKSKKNLWWILSIFTIVPAILGYAECWLVVWLIITLVVAILLIRALGRKKGSADQKKDTTPSQPQPPSTPPSSPPQIPPQIPPRT